MTPSQQKALDVLATDRLSREDAHRLMDALCAQGVHCTAEEVCSIDASRDDHVPVCCSCGRWLALGELDPPRDGRRVTAEVHEGEPANGSEVFLVVTYQRGPQQYACDQLHGRVRGVDSDGRRRVDGTLNGRAAVVFVDEEWLVPA